MEINILKEIFLFIKEYCEMDLKGIKINCPYWSNKIKNEKVIVRGILNGKGNAFEIKNELIKLLDYFPLTKDTLLINKLAKRKRLGIDCSGFVYRVLQKLVSLHFMNCQIKGLDEVFKGGINKTNADTLTNQNYSAKIIELSSLQTGDLLRVSSGKHVAIVLGIKDNHIIYAHSSSKTKIQGVHTGRIEIINIKETLSQQNWLEKTKEGENFGKKYFHEENGDGIYRLNIFNR